MLSLVAVGALGFGTYFVLAVRRYIGNLPTALIASENAVWLVWNAVIIYFISFPMEPGNAELDPLVIVLIFLLPSYAGLANFTWQGLLWRSFRKKS